ncbi:MAG: FG-GAP-like repeat-containing protein [Bacteroidetes bacterium]|nr:FG-GAP-like repeat-containing protein [Bacteroidota bacterium]MCL2301759.1 FG-GAP-like repeat-containing protein [Lentimicrobiaceae bacterium]
MRKMIQKNSFRCVVVMLHIFFASVFMLQAQNPVGAIPGVIDVSPMGAATYTIPIEVVPGTMGMQPNLSIVYNSFGGMGILGMKWNLAGLSAITRCGQTPYYDSGNTTTIKFNGNDRFALDGERLLRPNGGIYGAVGGDYATEVENFTRVVSYKGTTGHPEYFEAYTDDGTIIQYGHGNNSRQDLGGGSNSTLSWFVSRVTDVNGNFMTFHYEQSNNKEIWIDEIHYTGNTSSKLQPYARIKFGYTPLPDNLGKNTYFVGGYGVPQTKLLKTVTVFFGNTVVREYKFNYNEGGSGERTAHLKEVVLSGENGTQLNATTIEWGEQNTSIDATQQISGLPNGRILTGDFNGDGYTDIVIHNIGSNQNIWRLYLYSPSSKSYIFEREGFHAGYPRCRFFAYDLDSDGKDELIIAEEFNTNKWTFTKLKLVPNYTAHDIGTFENLKDVYFGNFHESLDYISRMLFLCSKDNRNYELLDYNKDTYLRFTTSNPYKIIVADIDGNGRDNVQLIMDVPSGIHTAYTYEYSGGAKLVHSDGFPTIWHHVYYGDFNGDGIKDALVYTSDKKWLLHIGKGDYTFIHPGQNMSQLDATPLNNTLRAPPMHPVIIADINGDGKDEIIQGVTWIDGTTGKTRLDFYYLNKIENDGTCHFNRKEQIPLNEFYPTREHYDLGDFNGDGKIDILMRASISDRPRIIYANKNEQYEFPIQITDGMGKVIKLTYNFGYHLAENLTYFDPKPFRVFKKYFLPTVKSLQVSNDIDSFDILEYSFSAPAFSCRRNAFLGFRRFDCLDYQSGKNNLLFYKIDDFYYIQNGVHYGNKEILVPIHHYISYAYPYSFASIEYSNQIKRIGVYSYRYIHYFDKITTDKHLYRTKTIATTTLDDAGRLAESNTKTYSSYNTDQWMHSETKTYSYETITLSDNQKKTVLESILSTQQYKKGNTPSPLIVDTTTYAYYPPGQRGRLRSVRKGNIHGSITTSYEDYFPTGVYGKKIVSAAGCESRIETYGYDNTQRFVTSMKNPDFTNLETKFSYDPRTGSKTSETGVNGLTTNYNYDAFGNLRRINYPDGTQTNISTHWHNASHPSNARYYTKTTSTGKPTLEVYYDILGREVCRLDDGNYIDTEYNSKGQVKRTSYPFNTTNAQEKIWHEYTYDAYGRIRTEKAPYTNLSYTYIESKVIVMDSLRNNVSSSKDYDALGRIINATDNNGSIVGYTYEITADRQHETYITTHNGITTILSDLWGNRLSIEEPNAGKITSKYNGFNELIEQKDANNNITKYQYDKLGRVTQKQYITSDTTHRTLTYEYDNFTATHKGRGKLHQIKINNAGSETFTYDSLSRLHQHTKVVSGKQYTHTYAYTAIGQLATLTYPNSFAVTYNYTPTGKLNEIRRSDDNSLIYKVNARNMYHAPTRCEYGNGVATHYTYTAHGLPTRIQTGSKRTSIPIGEAEREKIIGEQAYTLDSAILNYRYTYNEQGLMSSRSESVINRSESYTYDKLDRLTQINYGAIWQTERVQNFSYCYSGNIESNSRLGNYSYGEVGIDKPHAVTKITPVNHTVIPFNNCDVTYNFFNQPTQIIEGDYKLELSYGANQQRNMMIRKKEIATESIHYYINKHYEREVDYTTGAVRGYHYIYGDNGVVALYITNRVHSTDTVGGGTGELPDLPDYTIASTDSMYYIHTDHLGSYCAITNANKQVRQRNYFDPWGNYLIRYPQPISDTSIYEEPQRGEPLNTFTLTYRGFTGHEHYPFFKIINMNGRLYDPIIGRFFSPDKYVANSSFTQDFNRYSYARNNPLMYVDPTGDFIWFFPTFSWSAQGGLSVGFTFGVGIPGVLSASANVGYNLSNNDFSASVGVTAAFNTVYASYSTQSGFSLGWTAGLSSYAGLPFSSNIATIGVNWNVTNDVLSANISAAQWQEGRGWSFNPSFSAAILPQQFSNLVRGQGFRDHDQVLSRFVAGGQQQRALKYFGFRGTYDPNHEWFKNNPDPAITDRKGNIFYNSTAFEQNYDFLALNAYHELDHSQRIRSGRTSGMDSYEEWHAWMSNYRNQGLYPNYGESNNINMINLIHRHGMGAGVYPWVDTPPFSSAWWHFIYRIPRLW